MCLDLLELLILLLHASKDATRRCLNASCTCRIAMSYFRKAVLVRVVPAGAVTVPMPAIVI